MRAKRALGLCLPLLLVACSGGLLPTPAAELPPVSPPVTTAAPTTGITSAPTLLPAPQGGAESALQASAFDYAPEIAGGLLPPEERDRYLQRLNALYEHDEVAAVWLHNTGLFLRDAHFAGDEARLLDAILQGPGDALWLLSHIRTMEGVDGAAVEYLASIQPVPAGNWYFSDDIQELQAFDLLSDEGKRSLQRIFERAQRDSEVRLGLYLINMLGLPDPRAFQHQVPTYNVQLYLLARMLEQGVPGDYERAAVAAALSYGSLMTLCDAESSERVVAQALERVRFVIDTDVLLAAAGADWLARDYPLEALIVLLWSGQGAACPLPGRPLAQALPLDQAAAERQLNLEDVDRLLASTDTLQQMRSEMMRLVVDGSARYDGVCGLIEEWWSTNRLEEADVGGPDLDQQWARWLEGRGFAGGTEAVYVLQGLAAGINLPLPWAQLWYVQNDELQVAPFGLRLDPAARELRLGTSARTALAPLPVDTQAVLICYRLPWDNWRLQSGARGCQTLPLPLEAWRAGLPSGYLLRQGMLAGDGEVLASLGLAPTPAPAEPRPE